MFESKKEIVIIAGANGAGKTTFARAFLQEYDYEFLNADEIAKSLSAENPSGKKVSAGKLFFRKLDKAVADDKSILIESTLSGRYLEKIILNTRAVGYQISIIFLFADSADFLIERIAERVKKGGHFVPGEDVRRRLTRGKLNFWKIYKNLVDSWSLVYNSEGIFYEIALSGNGIIEVFDENLYRRFLQI